MLEIIRFQGDVEGEIVRDELLTEPPSPPPVSSPADSQPNGHHAFIAPPYHPPSDDPPPDNAPPYDPPPGREVSLHENDPLSTESRPVGARSVALCRQFVEHLVKTSVDVRRAAPTAAPASEVDWEELWARADEADSLEQAVGRAVLEADRVAHEIRGGLPLLDEDFAQPYPPVQARQPPALLCLPETALPEAAFTTFTAPSVPGDVETAPNAGRTREPPGFPDLPIEHRGAKRAHRRRRLASFFGWVQFTGVLLFAFVAWQLWGTGIAQHHAQASLAEQFNSHLKDLNSHLKNPPAKSVTPTLVAADVGLPEPPEGSVVAHLQIPSIGVDQYVVEGTAEGDLAKGPGHYVGTAMPGQAGNVAIAGHRTTYGAPFYDLNELVPGDVITLTTDSGIQLRYVESQVPFAVPPGDVSILNSFGDNRLTLTTCNPRYSSTQRLVAVAMLQTPVVTPVVATAKSTAGGKTEASQPGVDKALAEGSVGWHMIYLPEALLFLAMLVLLGTLNTHAVVHFGKTIRWIILVPLWLAVIYLLFGALTSLLPATL